MWLSICGTFLLFRNSHVPFLYEKAVQVSLYTRVYSSSLKETSTESDDIDRFHLFSVFSIGASGDLCLLKC